MDFDVVIKNVRVLDGTGGKAFHGAAGVKGDTIAAVAAGGGLSGSKSRAVVDGKGRVLCPGFIDIHSHDDLIFWLDAYNEPKLRQGVTTVVAGMCGSSPYPLPAPGSGLLEEIKTRRRASVPDYPWTARTLEDYCGQLESIRPAMNLVPVIGHGAVRLSVMGYEQRAPVPGELEEMKALLKEAFEAGAAGMSTGLIYAPGSYSDTGEIVELAKTAAEYGSVYFTHLRSESSGMPGALAEALEICRSASVPLHIGHLKCLGADSWHKAQSRLAFLEEAESRRAPLSWDQYPYAACSTGLLSLLPPRALKNGAGGLVASLESPTFRRQVAEEMLCGGNCSWENFYRHAGGWERIILSRAPNCEEFEGKSIAELAEREGEDPFSFLFNIIRRTMGAAGMVVFAMNEEDVEKILAHPRTCIGSDGIAGMGMVHPRAFGAFARVLGHYARDKKLFSLEEAVSRMTSLPARVLGLKDRGLIREGHRADMVILDPLLVKDTATYAEPRQHAEGITHVFVNGKAVISEGDKTGERPGRILLKS